MKRKCFMIACHEKVIFHMRPLTYYQLSSLLIFNLHIQQ